MNLLQVISSLSEYDEEQTIYAKEPWCPESEAIVRAEPDDGFLPSDARGKGLAYFLEIFVAKEFLEGWAAARSRAPSAEEKARRLIEYAVNDA